MRECELLNEQARADGGRVGDTVLVFSSPKPAGIMQTTAQVRQPDIFGGMI